MENLEFMHILSLFNGKMSLFASFREKASFRYLDLPILQHCSASEMGSITFESNELHYHF